MWNKCRSRKATWNGKEVIGCWTTSRCVVSLSCSYRYVSQESDCSTEIPSVFCFFYCLLH